MASRFVPARWRTGRLDSPAMTDHYFSAEPASSADLRRRRVVLAGREVEVVTAGGVFSPDGIDRGTAVLLRETPAPPATGTFLDLGCGWGPLALSLALSSPAARIYAVDVNRRALDLCRRNAELLGARGVAAVEPDQVPDDVILDLLWSNPPIRVGKAALHEMMLRWLPRLTPTGEAWLVVQKNLGADSLHTWLDEQGYAVERSATAQGFRVLRVARR